MSEILNYVYIPFAWIMRQFYNLSGNYVVALFFFAIVFKLILLPSSISQQKGTAKQQRLQPKIRRIQAKYQGNQQKIQEETQALYQREGYNPMGVAGCAPLLIQMPIVIILYEVIYRPLKFVLGIDQKYIDILKKAVCEIVPKIKDNDRQIEMTIMENFGKISGKVPAGIATEINDFISNFSMLGVPLTQRPEFSTLKNWATSTTAAKVILIIPLLSGLTALGSSLISNIRQKKTNPEMAKNPTMGCMTFGMPLLSVYFGFLFPAGIGVYWIFQNILGIIQMVVLNKTHSNEKVISKILVAETIERRARENNSKIVAEIKNKETDK